MLILPFALYHIGSQARPAFFPVGHVARQETVISRTVLMDAEMAKFMRDDVFNAVQ